MRRRADGTGAPQPLVKSPFAFAQASETHDGKWLLARRSFLEAGSGDIYGIREGDSTLMPLVTGPASEIEPTVSPDGRWLAYASNESGHAGGVRAAVPRRGVGAVAGVGRRRAGSDVVAQRKGAVLPEHRRTRS